MDTPSPSSASKICTSCNKEILPGEGHATHEGKSWHYGECTTKRVRDVQAEKVADITVGGVPVERVIARPAILGASFTMQQNGNAPPDTHKDLMVDIETLGTKPGCVVLSAAGVWFDRELAGTYVAFNDTYSIQDMLGRGLVIDPNTAKWWFEQEGLAAMVARMQVTVEVGHSRSLMQGDLNRANRIWSCGPDFDPPILSRALGLDWPFWKNRDVRTMRDMLVNVEKASASHDPLEDCERQIKEVRHAWIGNRQPLGTAGNSA